MATERKTNLGGRYVLGRRLAAGGMAEIFLARQIGASGFERHVVVKLLQERHRHDKLVVQMFVDEARIGGVLHHPHIVHVYDVGEHEGTPFIVMEFIDGEELSTLCRRGLELGAFLPAEHAVDLVRQAAEALGYVHSRADDAGESYGIVHRDISPSNLLVTRDGNLKIIDFGIARSTLTRSHHDGLIPGKYHYMSPEQVRGERVDHRSDIFSLGIVLYEITVAKRLFKGRPEEVIQKISKERIKPPTFVRRDFPPELERIVMRALESHPDDRYASGYELASDLGDFLAAAGWKSGPVRVARYVDELQARQTGHRRDELVVAGEAWVDDEGEEALDFGRTFADIKATPSPDGDKTKTARPAAPRRSLHDTDPDTLDETSTPFPTRPVAAVDEYPVVPPATLSEQPTIERPAPSSWVAPPPQKTPVPRPVAIGQGMMMRSPTNPVMWIVVVLGVAVLAFLAIVFLR
jgi:tRNA A-37 threonylcarbamoyl transferase component Bud32